VGLLYLFTVHKALLSSYVLRAKNWFKLARRDVLRLRRTPPLVSFFVGWLAGCLPHTEKFIACLQELSLYLIKRHLNLVHFLSNPVSLEPILLLKLRYQKRSLLLRFPDYNFCVIFQVLAAASMKMTFSGMLRHVVSA
jgi:hypothetical protein